MSVSERFTLSLNAQIGWSHLLFQAVDLSLTKSSYQGHILGMVHILEESGHLVLSNTTTKLKIYSLHSSLCIYLQDNVGRIDQSCQVRQGPRSRGWGQDLREVT